MIDTDDSLETSGFIIIIGDSLEKHTYKWGGDCVTIKFLGKPIKVCNYRLYLFNIYLGFQFMPIHIKIFTPCRRHYTLFIRKWQSNPN